MFHLFLGRRRVARGRKRGFGKAVEKRKRTRSSRGGKGKIFKGKKVPIVVSKVK